MPPSFRPEKGVYGYIKHFALNDQEDYRNGLTTFSNEQAIREIYLKPFQTCFRSPPARMHCSVSIKPPLS